MKLCAICGVNRATTVDHIPPQGLYPKPRPNGVQLHTVPACARCNNGSSVEDEEFKVMICLITGEFRENAQEVIDWIAKTLGKNKKLLRKILKTRFRTYTYLRSSILEPAIGMVFSGEHYQSVMARIVRALYWRETGRALGKTPSVTIIPYEQITSALDRQSFRNLMDYLEPIHLNNSTFIYKASFLEDGSSIWGLMFFNRHFVAAYADPPSAIIEPPPS